MLLLLRDVELLGEVGLPTLLLIGLLLHRLLLSLPSLPSFVFSLSILRDLRPFHLGDDVLTVQVLEYLGVVDLPAQQLTLL